jgi:hypothetical protein
LSFAVAFGSVHGVKRLTRVFLKLAEVVVDWTTGGVASSKATFNVARGVLRALIRFRMMIVV